MLLFKKSIIYFSLILSSILFLIGYLRPISFDYDLGRHILFGKIMIENKSIINTNLLSYANADFKYINSHWLSEIILYFANNLFEVKGLTLLLISISILTISILLKFTSKRVTLSSLAITFPIFTSFFVLRADIRPEIFSYLFTSIFIVLLYKFREKYSKLIFFLIPITLLWVNLHIYFAIGPLLVFLFLIEDLISKRKIDHKNKTLTVVFILCSISALINPNFIKGALYPLLYSNNYGIAIQENLSFFTLLKHYNPLTFLPHLTLFISSFALLFRYKKRVYKIDWFLFLVFCLASLLANRNFYIFLYVFFYSYSRLIMYLLADISNFLKKHVNKKQLILLKIFSYSYLCLIIIILITKLLYLQQGIGFLKSERGKPALDFYVQNNLKGPIYNSLDLGQYIAYRLYPKDLVYVDGRPEAYPSKFLSENYTSSQKNYNNFKKEDSKYKFNSIFIYLYGLDFTPLMSDLISGSEYKLVYLDTYAMVFVKNSAVNKKIIDKNEITEEKFIHNKSENEIDLSRYVIIFNKMGWDKARDLAFQQILKKDKSACILKKIAGNKSPKLQNLDFIYNTPSSGCKF